MLKRRMKRIFAALLAFVLVFGSFSGASVVHAEEYTEVKSVSVSKTAITNADREIEVTVTGTKLPETLYYRLMRKNTTYYDAVVDTTQIAVVGSTDTMKTFRVTIPENTSGTTETWKVWVNATGYSSGWAKSEEMTLSATGSSETPGGGDTPETFDNTVLKVKVVDGAGQAVEGVNLCLKSDNNPGFGDISFTAATDVNGKASYTCDDQVFTDDIYYLQPTSTSGYTCETPREVWFDEDENGDIIVTDVDKKAYTSEVSLTVVKEAPQVDKTKLDAAINAYVNVDAFTTASYQVYLAALEEAKAVKEDENATQEAVDAATKKLTNARNNLVYLDLKATAEPTKLSGEGGTVTVNVSGTLNEKVWWALQSVTKNANGVPQYTAVGKAVNEAAVTDGKATIEIAVPENSTEEVATYRVRVSASEPKFYGSYSWSSPKDFTITVAAKANEPANKADLVYQIEFSAKYEGKASEYTEDSYQKFAEALEAAKTVAADENATQDAVDTAKNALMTACMGLEKLPLCNETEIRILIVDEAGQKVTESIPIRINTSRQNITSGLISYDVSTADLGTQEIVVAFNAESVTIGDKEYELQPASHTFTLSENAGEVTVSEIDGKPLEGPTPVQFVLTEKQANVVDKTALTAKIAEMKAVTSEGYTAESYAALQTAISEAEAVKTKADATQAEVDAAVKALNDAYAALKSNAVDKSKLAKAIETEDNSYKNEAAFTTASWNAYKTALAAAREVNADETATQAQVDDAVKSLKAAVNGLTFLSLDKVTVTPDSLTSNGGTVTVKAEGILNAKVWWKLEKLNAKGDYDVVGESINEATLGEDGTFSVNVPANETESEETYRIQVKESEPSAWSWGTTKKVTITVAAKEPTPTITSVTPSAETVAYADGRVEVAITGTNLNADDLTVSVTPDAEVGEIAGTATEQKFTVAFPINTGISPKEYEISVNVKEQETTQKAFVTVSGVNTITGADALKNPEYILDVRDEETIRSTGSIPGSQFCPQFPVDDESLDKKMQEYAEHYKGNTDPIYIMCKSGLMGAPKATKNLLAAGINPARIFTILRGASDTDIKAALVVEDTPVEVNKAGLEKAIADAKAIDESKYTAESYAALTSVLDDAKAVMDNSQATQEQVDAQIKAIEEAVANLQIKTPNPKPGTENDYKAKLTNEKDAEAKVPLNEEEKAAIAAGAKLEVILKLIATSKTAETVEQKAIDAKIGSYKIGTFLDIELYKKVGDAEPEKVTETDDAIEITLEVPTELRNKDAKVTRTYKVMRYHEGVVEMLDTTFDAKTNMLTFKTDKFSTYALVYSDSTASTTNSSTTSTTPQTGDMANTSAYAAMLGISLLAIVVVLKKRKTS